MSSPTPLDDSPAGTPPAGPLPLITITLVLLNIAVYIFQGLRGASWIDPTPDQLMAAGGNVAMLTLTGDAWRLLSSVFIHGGPVHLLMNMYMLFLIGSLAERRFGRVGFLLLFLAGGVMASCASTWWQSSHTLGTDLLGRPFARLTVSVGASGGIMAILGALLSAHVIRSTFAESHEATEPGLGKSLVQVIAINVGMGLLIPGVDNSAHIGGVAAGLLMGAVIQFAAELASSLPAILARMLLPPALAAACAWALLNASDWSDLQDLRKQHDEEQQAEAAAASKEQEAAALQLAAEQEREHLPAPVSAEQARGQVIKFGDSGTSFALSADGKTAYAVDHYKNQISAIDLARGVVDRTIAGPQVPAKRDCHAVFCGGPGAADIVVLRAKPLALVTSMQKDAVAFVDLSTGQLSKSVPVGTSPNAILLSPDEHRAYVHNFGSNSISVVDVESATVARTIRLQASTDPDVNPGHRPPMWFSPDGSMLYVAPTLVRSHVQVFDVSGDAPLESEMLDYPVLQANDFSGGTGETTILSTDGIVIHGSRGHVRGAGRFCPRVPAPMAMAGAGVNGDAGYVAVADRRGYDGQNSHIRVANLRTQVTLGRYPITGAAMKLMLSADQKHVYVVNDVGEFIILDTRQRMDLGDNGELFCG